jgi:hypothetical protein
VIEALPVDTEANSYQGMMADPNGFKAHARGLDMLVRLRGGPQHLGLGNYLSTRVQQYDSAVHSFIGD